VCCADLNGDIKIWRSRSKDIDSCVCMTDGSLIKVKKLCFKQTISLRRALRCRIIITIRIREASDFRLPWIPSDLPTFDNTLD
jgi:hypothetical protein